MMGSKPTDEELELLTEEEREALGYDEDATDGDDEVVDQVAEPKVEEDPAPTDEKPADEEALADETPAEGQIDTPEAAEVVADLVVPEVDFTPKTETALPDEVKQRINEESDRVNAELTGQLKELQEKYDAGDLDMVEYLDQRGVVDAQINENRLDVRDTVRSQWQEQSVAAQRWDAEQEAFFKIYPQFDAPKYGADNALITGNPVLYGALDAACVKVAKDNPGLSGIDLLIKAKEEVEVATCIKVAGTPGARPSAQRPGHTLGDIPAAAAESVGDGEFASLDKLGGDDLEDALASMSPAQRERYLAG